MGKWSTATCRCEMCELDGARGHLAVREGTDGKGEVVTDGVTPAVARRIVDDHNALAGVPEDGTVVAKLVEACQEALRELTRKPGDYGPTPGAVIQALRDALAAMGVEVWPPCPPSP